MQSFVVCIVGNLNGTRCRDRVKLQTARAQRGNPHIHFHSKLLLDQQYVPYNTSPGSMHIPDPRSMFCIIPPTLAVAVFIFHSKLYVNMSSVELPAGGVHAMNNVVLTKWHTALSITLDCSRITKEWFKCYDCNKQSNGFQLKLIVTIMWMTSKLAPYIW